MRVLVTRPADQAREWVDRLAEAGWPATALPLIAIAPPADTQAVAATWATLAAQDMVLFVSPNAVLQFFALRPAQAAWPASLLAASTGPGTTQALRDCGVSTLVEPAADAAQFDSEALWQQLAARDWAAKCVLVVRGSGGRDWLADRLRECGARLSFVAAYQRALPQLSAPQQALLDAALAQPAQHLWLFSSSEAIEHLQVLAPGADWSMARAVATHPRIAERALALGMVQVCPARPTLEAVVACLQSFAP